MVQSIWHDVRNAAANLLRNPGFTLVALLTLALGIGANTVIFSVIRAVLLQPLPYEAPHQLVTLWTTLVKDDLQQARSSYANVEDWRRQTRTLADIAVYDPIAATLSGPSLPQRVTGVQVSANFFSLLGASPALGRTFDADEAEQRQRVVVLSDELWRGRLGADPAVLGEEIVIDGAPSRIIGVMPADFRFSGLRAAFWAPHTLSDDWSQRRNRRGTDIWMALGRLRPGASVEDAQVELGTLAKSLEQAFPQANEGLGVRVVPLHDQLTGDQLQIALWALWGAVCFVLLIACVNVANLLLARGAKRRKEMAIRAALGAGRARLVRLLITECLLLSALGGALGATAAVWGLRLLPRLGAGAIPRADQVSTDGVLLGFSLLLALATGVIFGLVPALEASRPDLKQTLGESGRSSHGSMRRRLRNGLVIAELALALVTLAGAGLLARSLVHLLEFEIGFEARNVLYAQVALPQERFGAERVDFYRQVLERAASLDGVEATGAINDLFVGGNPNRPFTIEGRSAPSSEARPLVVDEVTPGFFPTLSVPLLRGRLFTQRDRADSIPVAIINQTMALRYWGAADPVGQRLQLGPQRPDGPWLTVVGVVGDFRRSGPESGTVPQLFLPHAQQPSRSMNLLLRTTGTDPLTVAAALRAQVAALNPSVPVYAISTLEQRLDGYASQRRFQTRLLALFSAAALLLGAIGIYGLISQSVQQRVGEIGVRMALGATRSDILRMMLREGLLVTVIGLGAGLAGAIAVARLLRNLLFEVSPFDPATLLVVCLLLAGTAMLSCYFPARRAARLDPLATLRD